MGAKTAIEWTDCTWSPIRARVKPDAAEIARAKGYTSLVRVAEKMAGHVGPHCEHVSDGCENCYAGTMNARCLPTNGTGLPFDRRARDLVDVHLDEKMFAQPLHWRRPRRAFVENQSDLFGEWVPDELIDRVFAVMALTPHITYQVLTKRAERMCRYFERPTGNMNNVIKLMTSKFARELFGTRYANADIPFVREQEDAIATMDNGRWPLPNVWLGVSVEDQQRADERIPWLLKTPAAVRFISAEPLLGPVDLGHVMWGNCQYDALTNGRNNDQSRLPHLDQVIVGGESGPDARPLHPDWARSIRDQCVAANVAFFFKQNGEYASVSEVAGPGEHHYFPGWSYRTACRQESGR